MNLGLVHVYTGEGKGKTSAAMGLALRAIGQGMKAYVIQFLKGGAYTGELIATNNFLPNIEFRQFGKHCMKEEKQMKLLGFDRGHPYFDYVRPDIECGDCRYCFVNDEEQQQLVRDAFALAKKVSSSGDYDIVILDELSYALAGLFVSIQEVVELIKNKAEHTELVITGRNAPHEIKQMADYVTEMKRIRHPYQRGIKARRGIEY